VNKLQQRNFIIAGSIGALIAFVSLIIMAFLPRPFEAMDHFSILSGLNILTKNQLSDYRNYVALNLTWDSLYLIGHIVMWSGYAAFFYRDSKYISFIVLVLGFASGWLDFTENEIRWAILEALTSGHYLPIEHITEWQTTFGLSFYMLFICALLCGIAVVGKSYIRKVVFFISIVGLFIAPLSYQFSFLPAFLWIIGWHAISALFLWKSRHV